MEMPCEIVAEIDRTEGIQVHGSTNAEGARVIFNVASGIINIITHKSNGEKSSFQYAISPDTLEVLRISSGVNEVTGSTVGGHFIKIKVAAAYASRSRLEEIVERLKGLAEFPNSSVQVLALRTSSRQNLQTGRRLLETLQQAEQPRSRRARRSQSEPVPAKKSKGD